MPRLAGQIDVAKNEAILDAAVEALAERGLGASIEEIARRAGVSKQTIYNHYGCKAELVRALAGRRSHAISAPLETPGAAENPKEALAGYARILLQTISNPRSVAVLRLAVAAADEMPDVARAMFDAGARASRARLAEFLRKETEAGRLATPDPMQAAEFFGGMVVASHQLAGLLGVGRTLSETEVAATADEAAARFMRAFAP